MCRNLYILLSITSLFLTKASCHGLLTDPRQRGALRVANRLVGTINEDAPFDPYAHFPAGDKSIEPGSGKRSIERAAAYVWTPYDPLNAHFKWRAGVCGDELYGSQEHLKGGKYYFPNHDAVRVRQYSRGDIIDIQVNVVAHHNGFFEFHICNLDQCGGDISIECFQRGHCRQLQRAASFCDEVGRTKCGPIDSRNRGRWYLPCGPYPEDQIIFGGNLGSMKYKLPEDLVCTRCVLQWYWCAANTCNPPGLLDYFLGGDRPIWPQCKGQGGAVGGFTQVQKDCGGDVFPEEYWQCSDIGIARTGRREVPLVRDRDEVRRDSDKNRNKVDEGARIENKEDVGGEQARQDNTFKNTASSVMHSTPNVLSSFATSLFGLNKAGSNGLTWHNGNTRHGRGDKDEFPHF